MCTCGNGCTQLDANGDLLPRDWPNDRIIVSAHVQETDLGTPSFTKKGDLGLVAGVD